MANVSYQNPATVDLVLDSTNLGGSPEVHREIVVAGDPTTAANLAAIVAKGVQGAFARAVQALKDAGRTPITLTLDSIAGITTEALATMTINKGGTVTSVSQYTVSAGKTLRIISMALTVVNPSTTAASSRARLRSAGTVAASSPIFAALVAGAPSAVAQAGGMADMAYPDGIEFAAGQQVGISHIESSAIASGVSVCVVGFEY